jgi:hypothetical protein
MPGWRDRMAGVSSHPSARAYVRSPLPASPPSADGVHTDRQRRDAERAWGLRYGQEIEGLSEATTEEAAVAAQQMQDEQGWDFTPSFGMPLPGTAEFTRRYIPPGEAVIEQIEQFGPEGFRIVRRVDGITGELIEEASEVIGNLGPGEIVPGA